MLALDPGADRVALSVENHQVSVCTSPKRPLSILNSEASVKTVRDRKHEQKKKPAHFAGLKVAHLIASPSEHPVKREKLRTHVSKVTTLKQTKSETERKNH